MVSNKRKAIATLLGAIALACVGNAAWELVVKPLGSYMMDGVLSIMTLGLDSLRDDLYLQGARGRHDLYSSLLGTALTALHFSLWIALGFFFLRRAERYGRQSAATAGDDSRIERNRRTLRRSAWFTITFTVCLAFLALIRTVYISDLGAVFNQRMTILAPYISSHERLTLDSKFARIATREDYIALMSALLSHYQQAGLKPFKIKAF
jgi:predicted PurR-regulated permease PerM